MATVKEYTLKKLGDGATYIIDDDRAAEVADLIVIRGGPDALPIDVSLVHLKASTERMPGARVEDFYDLLGQASRSVVWCDSQRLANRLIHRLSTGSQVVLGYRQHVEALLEAWASAAVPVRWRISIVQPGLRASLANSTQNIKIMLNDLLEWTSQHDISAHIYAHDS